MYASVLMLTGLGAPEGDALTPALRAVTVLTAFLSVRRAAAAAAARARAPLAAARPPRATATSFPPRECV